MYSLEIPLVFPHVLSSEFHEQQALLPRLDLNYTTKKPTKIRNKCTKNAKVEVGIKQNFKHIFSCMLKKNIK